MIESFEIPAVQRIVSRQLERWQSERLAAEERRHAAQPSAGAPHSPWITLSREPGAGGHELAQLLSQRLGYEVYDRNLLDRMAAAGRLDPDGLARVESGPHDRLQEAVYLSLDRAYPGHHAYLKQLISIGTALAARGRVILLGRGLHLLIPAEHGLRVRLVAPLARRIERVRAHRDCGEAAAREWIERTDRNQIDLVRHMLRRDLRDVYAYDVVFNTGSMPLSACAAAIEAALQSHSEVWPAVSAG